MNVCNTCDGNPSNSCGEISRRVSNVNLVVTLEEKSSDQQIHHQGKSMPNIGSGHQVDVLFH